MIDPTNSQKIERTIKMKVISLPETAFEVLTAANDTMTFAELYGKVAEIAEMSEEEKAARIGQFYTDISLDGRFVGLTDNTWDLRSRHTYDKVHIDVNDVYSEVDEGERDAEDAKEEAEYDASIQGTVVSDSDDEEAIADDGEAEAKSKESKEAAELVGMGKEGSDY